MARNDEIINMKLSIIIVSFNTRDVLRTCLESLFSHYGKELQRKEFEITVVDNGSQDQTQEMMRKNFPKVKLIQNTHNAGFAKANNQGVKNITSDYVLFLNPDTVVPANTLTEILTYLDEHPHVGIATCKVLLPNGTIDDA